MKKKKILVGVLEIWLVLCNTFCLFCWLHRKTRTLTTKRHQQQLPQSTKKSAVVIGRRYQNFWEITKMYRLAGLRLHVYCLEYDNWFGSEICYNVIRSNCSVLCFCSLPNCLCLCNLSSFFFIAQPKKSVTVIWLPLSYTSHMISYLPSTSLRYFMAIKLVVTTLVIIRGDFSYHTKMALLKKWFKFFTKWSYSESPLELNYTRVQQ